MNKQKWLLLVVSLALIAGGAGALKWVKAHQKLGDPGVKWSAIPGEPVVLQIELPEKVLDYSSEILPQAEAVLKWLPKDTSYAQRSYTAPDGFRVTGNIILMGMDRTSIHKPDLCLPGQGWTIESRVVTNLWFNDRPFPIAKWIGGQVVQGEDGQKHEVKVLFVFWLVADGQQTAEHNKFMALLSRDLLFKAVLQRWAYVSFSAVCPPGQEEAAFARMEQLIGAAVPQFQISHMSRNTPSVARQ